MVYIVCLWQTQGQLKWRNLIWDRYGPCVINMRRMYVKRSQKLLKMITSLKRPWNSGRFPLYFTHHTFCDFSWRSHYIHHQNWPILKILVYHANCTPSSHFSHAPPDFYLSLGWSGSCMKRLTKLKQLKDMRPTNLTRGYLLLLLDKIQPTWNWISVKPWYVYTICMDHE